MYYSIDNLLQGNVKVIIFYIAGSVLGKYFGMKLGNPENQIWKSKLLDSFTICFHPVC